MDIKHWYAQLAALAAEDTCRGADPAADWQIAAHNPYCGDDITLYISLADEEAFRSIRYDGVACQVCCASTAIMAGELRDQPLSTLTTLFEQFTHALRHGSTSPLPEALTVFQAIRDYPVRRKCALLPWQAAHEHMTAMLANHFRD